MNISRCIVCAPITDRAHLVVDFHDIISFCCVGISGWKPSFSLCPSPTPRTSASRAVTMTTTSPSMLVLPRGCWLTRSHAARAGRLRCVEITSQSSARDHHRRAGISENKIVASAHRDREGECVFVGRHATCRRSRSRRRRRCSTTASAAAKDGGDPADDEDEEAEREAKARSLEVQRNLASRLVEAQSRWLEPPSSSRRAAKNREVSNRC